MNNMNYQEIIKEIKKQCSDVSEFAHEGLEGEKVYPEAKYGTEEYSIYKNPVLGIVKEVNSYGGEGKGEAWWVVYYFQDHDVYIRVDGYYQSYNGTDFEGWSSCTEVRPQERKIVVYE